MGMINKVNDIMSDFFIKKYDWDLKKVLKTQ
jgi:hypothetical protein